jgi:hypothetical protein
MSRNNKERHLYLKNSTICAPDKAMAFSGDGVLVKSVSA